jgi:hypothetical protein
MRWHSIFLKCNLVFNTKPQATSLMHTFFQLNFHLHLLIYLFLLYFTLHLLSCMLSGSPISAHTLLLFYNCSSIKLVQCNLITYFPIFISIFMYYSVISFFKYYCNRLLITLSLFIGTELPCLFLV